MKRFIILTAIMLLAWNSFSQLNIVDSKPVQSTTVSSQSNNITIKLPFTAISGSNNLVDNYLCYNGKYYYINAKKTSSSSDKDVSFVLGTNRKSSVETLSDLLNWLSNNTIGSSITVEMEGTKHIITKKEDDILSFSTSGTTGMWLLDEGQLRKSVRYLTQENNASRPDQSSVCHGRGGSGSGGCSGSGIGSGTVSGLGSGEGSGGGVGYGTGHRGMINNIDATINAEGQVCVEVHVAADGHVIDARVINDSKHKTTVTNRNVQQQCVIRAKQAIYKPGKEELRIIIFS